MALVGGELTEINIQQDHTPALVALVELGSMVASPNVLKSSGATAEAGALRLVGEGGSIRNVNPTRGTLNCANCAVATDATLAGSPASALPGGVTQARQLAAELGGTWVQASGPSGISTIMQTAGPGARGIVFGGRTVGIGHFFNVVNQRGTIRFVDGQAGGAANLAGYDDFWLLRTK